jgi:hypothetical protein
MPSGARVLKELGLASSTLRHNGPRVDPREMLAARLPKTTLGPLDVRCPLEHFLMASFAVPPERLASHVPLEHFELDTIDTDDGPRALVSAVSFVDVDFHFAGAPFARFGFGQTNYRLYVRRRDTGEPCAWFFGTTLGSPVVHVARALWKIPWHEAEYRVETASAAAPSPRYTVFRTLVRSDWADAYFDVEDTGAPLTLADAPGFADYDEMFLRLTHPVEGYFRRLDGRLGTYRIWHERLALRVARPRVVRVSLFERLGLLTAQEMEQPHSLLLANRVLFHVHMPPRAWSPRPSHGDT